MRFPKRITHRRATAVIYGKTPAKAYYRVAWHSDGKRLVKSFQSYSDALKHAETTVRAVAKGSRAASLSPDEASDALAVLDRLSRLFRETGRQFSPVEAVNQFSEAQMRLNGGTLVEAIEGYLRTCATIKRVTVSEAIEEFLKAQEPRTKSKEGQRAQLSEKYLYSLGIRLRRFGSAFPNTSVSELRKEHLESVFTSKLFSEFSAKSRNHYRAAFGQFLSWCVRRDYLPGAHRLGEADCLRPEHANTAEVQFYSPPEFNGLLEASEGAMRPMLAIAGLAGLRTAELLKLTWQEVFGTAGHIQVTAAKAKTRARRLVEIVPALALWLEPYRETTGPVWRGNPGVTPERNENLFHERFAEVCERAGVERKENGLRHAFGTFHFALHSHEGQTAQQMGNSPGMVHGHYKGLATKAEAERWFATAPLTAGNIVRLTADAMKSATS